MTELEEIVAALGIESSTSRYWVELFNTLPPHLVGIVKASGKLLAGQPLEQLALEMSFMANVGKYVGNGANKSAFYLPLVLGGGVLYYVIPSYKNSKKVNSKKVHGYRVTSKEMMEEMLPLAEQIQQMVVEALIKHGANAVAIPFENVFAIPYGVEIDKNGEEVDMGLAGKVAHIDTKPIISAIYQKQIPVVSHIGIADDGTFYNINADDVAVELAKRLRSKKLIFVGDTPVKYTGGDNKDEIISNIYSPEQFEALVADGTVKDGMEVKLKNSYELLKYLGTGHAVQITAQSNSSLGLIIELLTNKGSGTMLSMPHITTAYPMEAVDTESLTSLINKSFAQIGKQLVPYYFDGLIDKDTTFYMDGMEKGLIVAYPVQQDHFTFEYLCKIATEPGYEGMGIATSILDTVLLEKKSIAWRASPSNTEAIAKYKKFADENNGLMTQAGNYLVFTVGIPYEKQAGVVEKVASIEPTLMAA